MAKDVDLSSQEWRDIVFEGKNKDFGAYTLRSASDSRHNKATFIVLVCLAVVLTLLILMMKGVFSKAEEEQLVSATEQEIVTYEPEEEEIEEEEVFEIPEEPEEVIAPEEVANEQRITDLLIVQDDDFQKDKEVKNQEEMMENEAQAGTIDITEGTNDLNKVTVKEQVIAETKPVEEEKVYNIAMVEQKPEFAGGEAAMYKWLSDHINYPAAAAEDGVQGRVVVEFEVSKTGSIEKVRVIRGRHPALDKEALRVVKAMPKWNPGRNNGQPVKVTFLSLVTFRLLYYFFFYLHFHLRGLRIPAAAFPLSVINLYPEKMYRISIAVLASFLFLSTPVRILAEDYPLKTEKVYNIAMVEQKPEFKGGETAMYKWLADNIRYPAEAIADGAQGRVVVGFTVTRTGAIENVHVLRGRHPALDKEAIRVVKAMPEWNPGRNNGQLVNVSYALPVTFRLPDRTESHDTIQSKKTVCPCCGK